MLITGFFLTSSTLVMLIAALGLLRLPNALARQHAATKAATLAISLFIFALISHAISAQWGWAWTIRLLVLLIVLFITLPLAAHALGRSAVAEKQAP